MGGREVNRSHTVDGPKIGYEATFQDIVASERIVYSYDMHMDDRRISVSLSQFSSSRLGQDAASS